MLWFGKKKEEPQQCFGTLQTGTQTIPCPRTVPCIHHPEGKGAYDLRLQVAASEKDDFRDTGELTDSEKLDGIIDLLEELNDGIRPIAEALGFRVEGSEQLETDEEEELVGEGETNEEADSKVEPAPQQSEELSLDDIPTEDSLA